MLQTPLAAFLLFGGAVLLVLGTVSASVLTGRLEPLAGRIAALLIGIAVEMILRGLDLWLAEGRGA